MFYSFRITRCLCIVTLCLIYLLTKTNVFAQNTNYETLHEHFNLNENMTIKAVTDTLCISLTAFKDAFTLDKTNHRIDRRSLKQLNIDLENVYQHYDSIKLNAQSQHLKMPFKVLAKILDVPQKDPKSRELTLGELRQTKGILDFGQIQKDFENNKYEYTGTLIVLGLLVVFFALLMTSLVISKMGVLVHTKKDTKLASVVTPIGRVLAKKENLSPDAVIAVIMAIHRHKMQSIADHQIILTWRRANINMWKASTKTDLPTITYNFLRRTRQREKR